MDKTTKKIDKLVIILFVAMLIFFAIFYFHEYLIDYFGVPHSLFIDCVFAVLALFLIYIIMQLKKSSRSLKDNYKNNMIKKENELTSLNEQLKKSNQDLKYQLYTDTLTKLQNRRALERDIAFLDNPKLIILDIDSFKDINEYYGNKEGNFILCEVANILQDFSKKEEMNLYRIGADEFALLEDRKLDVDRYEELATIISSMFKSKMLNDINSQDMVEINVTLGFALEKDNILEKASIALKEAKEKQIDYQCYFKKIDRKKEYVEQIKWSKFIKDAISDSRVIPYFQPIFNADKKIIKYECLVRILDENEEVFPPGLFLEISKKVKRYVDIEKLLIEKSFIKIKKTGITISINLLARDMSDSNVSNFVIAMLKKYNVAKQVIFEILEDENIAQLDRVEGFIQKIKRMGCKIAIDDFGTGYSNFSYLMKLHPDYIKIDGSLIKNINSDKKSYAIANSIIAFARKLDIKIIAEYVHSKEVFEICKDLGVDEFQGFYLGEPTARIQKG
ncbi:MAG: bifunctional diguanylate cyclase/phosphodiesterase [Epsilonproteobacteria bacterium]|nr:bifunctional diguanylate cyclase/phosphodiesterase [Campylobacterota bacterium]